LLACSHPTQASPPAQPAPASAEQAAIAAQPQQDTGKWPVIVAFGDSLTAGFGTESDQTYPDFLQLDLAHDGYHYRVVNLGVSGNTTKDGVARVKDVLALHPALVIVALGGNDGLRGSPVSDMRANLDQILTVLAQSHTPIVLGGITLPPNYGPAYVQQFNAVYPELAKKFKAPLLPFMLQDVWNHPALMQDDGIHPKAAGYVIVAHNFVPLVEPMLKKN
jgi:acyl-CoA thioesterase-1